LYASVHAGAFVFDHVVQLLCDVVVDTTEIPLLEFLLPTLTQLLEHLLHTHELLTVAVLKTLLEHAAHRGVEVAVVQEFVGHLGEQRIGIEIETDLGSVPRRVLEPRGLST